MLRHASSDRLLPAQTRQNFGVVELDGLIYVLGGENEATELTAVEVFDPHFNTWKPQTSMTMVRSVRAQERLLQTGTPRSSPGIWVGLDRGSVGVFLDPPWAGGGTSWSTPSPKLLPFQPPL